MGKSPQLLIVAIDIPTHCSKPLLVAGYFGVVLPYTLLHIKKNIIHDLGIPVFRGPPEEGVVRTSQMQKGVLRWKGPGKNW